MISKEELGKVVDKAVQRIIADTKSGDLIWSPPWSSGASTFTVIWKGLGCTIEADRPTEGRAGVKAEGCARMIIDSIASPMDYDKAQAILDLSEGWARKKLADKISAALAS